jgi:threonine/homoserine/homoserine lactone efflux protein
MNYAMLSLYAATAFTLIATPGPVVALVINTNSIAGPRRALMTAFGSNWASLTLMLIGTLVLSGTIAVRAEALDWISLAGCVSIVQMSWRRWRSAARHPASGDTPMRERHPRRGGFMTGFLTGVSNPGEILFFVSFFPQFTAVTESFSGSIAVLTVAWVVLDVAILAAYVYFAQLRSAQRYQHVIARTSSGVLLLTGASGLVLSSSRLLTGAL